jgi:hypothetical protein
MSNIVVLNGALEDDSETNEIVLRGTIDPSTLKYIHLDWYQREQGFSPRHINNIMSGLFTNGRVADLTLGMRGHRVQTRGASYILQDKVYCIDGGQRLRAMAMALHERPSLKLSVGAKIHFGTTEQSENEMFCKLGTSQIRIAASVLLRDMKKISPAANVLLSLNRDPAFALNERVAWDQTKRRSELITGFMLARVAGALHAHKGSALHSTTVNDLVIGLDNLVTIIGEDNLRLNVIRFFDTIDRCWNIRNLSGHRDEERPHLNLLFLMTICSLMSRYPEFWVGVDNNEFQFPDRYIKRLKGFTIADYLRPARTKADKEWLFDQLRKRLGLHPIFEDGKDFGKSAAA